MSSYCDCCPSDAEWVAQHVDTDGLGIDVADKDQMEGLLKFVNADEPELTMDEFRAACEEYMERREENI